MKLEKKRRKKRGSFLSAIGFFLFFLTILVALAIGGAYVYRDQLLVQWLKQQDPKTFGLHLFELDSVVTRPIGSVSVEIQGLVLQTAPNAPLLRADKLVLATPKNVLQLYRLTLAPELLALKAQLIGLNLQATTSADSKATETTAGAGETRTQPLGLPFPLDIEAEIRDSRVEAGAASQPLRLEKINGIVRTKITQQADKADIKMTGQLVMGVGVGARSLPVRTDWTLEASPLLVDPSNVLTEIKSLTISSLGMSLKSSGSLKLPEQKFDLQISGNTPDLSVLPLDKAESDALGLDGRLKGQAEVSLKVAGALGGTISTEGLVIVKNGVLPFALTREKPRAMSVTGPVSVDVEIPFKAAFDLAKDKLESVDIQLATLKADLSGATIRVAGTLNKPASMPMTLNAQVTGAGETIDISQAELRLANAVASVKGVISIDPKRSSKIDFSLSVPSLEGWPLLLPILGTLEGGATRRALDVNAARGAITIKAKVDAPISLKEEIKVVVEQLDANGVEFPINIRRDIEKKIFSGTARGHLTAAGAFEKTADGRVTWSVKRSQGSIDLKDVELQYADFLNKTRGHDFVSAFSISSTGSAGESAAKIEKFDARLRDSTFGVKGSVAYEKSGNLRLDTLVSTKTALSQLYELIPMMRAIRAKVPTGTVLATTTLTGVFDKEKGVAGSKLTTNGRIGLKAPKAFYLEADSKTGAAKPPGPKGEPDAATAESEEASVLKWPIVANSKQIFDVQIDSAMLRSSELKSVNVLATLAAGNLNGTLNIANAFGGGVKVTSFQILDLPRKPDANLKLSASGAVQNLNLSQAGEFINPAWKTLVGGFATGPFDFSFLPLSKSSLVDTATAKGTLAIKQGYLSTVSLDQMVNKKIAEYPLIAKLAGAPAKVSTKGVSLNLATAYAFKDGRVDLQNLVATTPEKNELRLEGWLQKDFTADLKGTAYLAETSIGGSFRQANSDKSGRLVVPIHITGSLKEPNLAIAEDALSEMAKKTVNLEANKIKKSVKEKAFDAVKEELKKRGLGF